MAIFTAAAAAIVGGLTGAGFAAAFAAAGTFTAIGIATSVLAATLALSVSSLIAKRMARGTSGNDGGGRVQLPPATDNKIPVVYGSAFVSGPVIDAKISTDNKTMWYVVALAEHTDTTAGTGYTFLDTYYDGKYVEFASPTSPNVTALITNNASPSNPSAQRDTRMAGNLFIYKFTNGSSSGVNTGGLTAIQILQDSQIPLAQRWTANHTMTNCAFVIVKVIYNQDKGVVSLGSVMAQLSNNLNKPGDVIKDYLLNTRYGCGVPLARIDTASLTDLNTYSDATITYIDVFGNPQPQPRYRINGPLDTANNCLDNLSILVDACDSWLQYSELTGRWRVVMNKGYAQAPNAQTLNQLFAVNDDNLVGGIQLAPIDLNSTYNQVEVAYPNKNIKDQTDYQIVDLTDSSTAWYDPSLLSPNEAINKLNLQLPVVNEAVQAKYIAVRRLLQSREDLIIQCQLDYSGIQIDAGDVIRVTNSVYGWTDKLFRVSNVAEEKYPDGSLGVSITAFEYNNTIFNDNAIQDFIPDPNTGLLDPNALSQPGVPTVVNNPSIDGQVKSFKVTSYVPDFGTILYMDFNYGNTSNVELHQLYRTVQVANGTPFTNSDSGNVIFNNVAIDINDLPAGNYYFSTTGRNDFSGRASNASVQFNWAGANLNANSTPGNVIQPNTLPGNTLIANTVNGNVLIANTVNGDVIIANTINGNSIIANTINGNTIIANTINGNSIIANTIDGNTIIANTINGNSIIANTIDGNTIIANTMSGNRIVANTASGNVVIANTLSGNTVIANTLNGNSIIANTVNGNVIINGTLPYDALQTGTSLSEIFGLIEAGSNGAGLSFSLTTDFFYLDTSSNNYLGNGYVAYLDGTDPGANYVYPWFQGTSSTANGYLANSTGSFEPLGADQIAGPSGTDGFYTVACMAFPANSIANNEGCVVTADLQLVANIDSTIQVATFFNDVANSFSILTAQMTTVHLKANIPQRPYIDTISYFGNMNSIIQGGVSIKNITANSRVYVADCELFVGKNRVV